MQESHSTFFFVLCSLSNILGSEVTVHFGVGQSEARFTLLGTPMKLGSLQVYRSDPKELFEKYGLDLLPNSLVKCQSNPVKIIRFKLVYTAEMSALWILSV